MEIKGSKKSNRASNPNNPDNSVVAFRGQKGAACLVTGINVPKAADGESMPAKAAKVIVDSYMRRPALSPEAMDAIYKRANDCVLVSQNPQYPSFASMSAVFFIKNKFVLSAAGDNVIYHFVDGVLKDVFSGATGEPEYLGNVRFTTPKISDQIALGKGENTFLICSKKFAESFNENFLEESLIRATHVTQKGKNKITEVKCDRWTNELWDHLNRQNNADDYSVLAFTLPQKRKSLKMLIIGIIIAVVLLAAAFFAIGFFTRGRGPQSQPPKEGDPSMTEPLYAPGDGQQYNVTGPNGEQAPAPPTRPPQN